ncbi:hypothetical protein KLP28_08055 [Nocardioidaceae bacterium]|nr:hypothetical protein KLP28_08055 [Nocardioidaceae bacterium]
MKWFGRAKAPSAEEQWDQHKAAITAAKESRFAQTVTRRDLVAEVSRILFEADPIGINFESNTDEYVAEAETIVIALPHARNADDVRALTYETFVQWFDPETAGPIERYRAVSAEIWHAWQRDQGQAALSAPETTSGLNNDADATVRGLKITGINFVHDFIEVHMDDVILTGYTEPFGIIGCQGVGPSSITQLIGKTVEQLSVVEGEYVAIDSGENRLAFPIGGPSVKGPESVRLYVRGQDELGIRSAHWIW